MEFGVLVVGSRLTRKKLAHVGGGVESTVHCTYTNLQCSVGSVTAQDLAARWLGGSVRVLARA